jgi:hypothetical protein
MPVDVFHAGDLGVRSEIGTVFDAANGIPPHAIADVARKHEEVPPHFAER